MFLIKLIIYKLEIVDKLSSVLLVYLFLKHSYLQHLYSHEYSTHLIIGINYLTDIIRAVKIEHTLVIVTYIFSAKRELNLFVQTSHTHTKYYSYVLFIMCFLT